MRLRGNQRVASTLADVAEVAGVSRSTVSRALNDSPRISEATKRRVRAAAKQVNFAPNARGRALATGRSDIIAILVTEPLSALFADPTYGSFLMGINEELAESSCLPVILQASTERERRRIAIHFERRAFDAVIDISPVYGCALLENLRRLGIPCVLCGQLEGHPYQEVFSTVYSDDIAGARLAAEELQRVGRTHVVAIVGPRGNSAVNDRLRGYRAVYGEVLSEDRIVYGGWSDDDGYAAMRSLLAGGLTIDGILAGSDRIAAGALRALSERGIDVPRAVSIVGFDDHELARHVNPPLTTVAQPLREEGAIAVRLAQEMISGGKPQTRVMQMHLVRRMSA